jgi:hypothetical protein
MEDFYMVTMEMYFDKETFEPGKNYFSIEKVKCSRPRTEPETHLREQSYKWSCIGFHCIGWGCLVGLIFMITFSVLAACFSNWFYAGTALGAILFVGGIIFANAVCWPTEQKYSEELMDYRREHEEELWAEATKDLKAYNEEQKRIAESWRAEHPLEEKIRACIKDPMSSVDIANLARYYAEVYIKETSNEN